MAANQDPAQLVSVLRAAGVELSLDTDGDLLVEGGQAAMAVWTAMTAAIERLDKLIIAELEAPKAEPAESGSEEPAAEPEAPRRDPAAALAKFCDQAPMAMARLSGGPVFAPPEPMPWAPKAAPAMYTPEQMAWVSKKQRATYLREPFDEPPPDDMPDQLY
jgi:hypothetical protein